MSATPRITILGSGVSGLSCGILLAESGFNTRIISDLPPLQTTSNKSAAFWYPYHVKGYQPQWAIDAFERFLSLSADSRTHVRIVPSREFFERESELNQWLIDCQWRQIPAVRFRRLARHEIPPQFAHGIGLMLPVIYMPGYLPYLMQRYGAARGAFEQRQITHFDQVLGDADLIINCTGLGARELAADSSVYPSQGQVVSIAPLPFDELILAGSGAYANEPLYIVPRHGHDIILGGTTVDHANDLVPDPAISRRIIDRCAALFPIFRNARILDQRIGLRPARQGGVRTESDSEFLRTHGKPLIHNYGHGGGGVSLSWGCALEVLRLVRLALK